MPATTANVGPGFDSLGIALGLYNEVRIYLSKTPEITLLGKKSVRQDYSAAEMVREAGKAFFQKTGIEEQRFTVEIQGKVPIARGLGSSVTVRLGIVAGLNELFGKPLKKHEMLEMVSELEGHPDNAAPAIYGGFAVSGIVGEKVACIHKKLPKNLKFVAAIPDYEVETEKARGLLPASLPFKDAVHNVNRASLLVAAFWNGDYEKVGDFLEDRLHQSVRSTLVPQLFPCIKATKSAGAIGGWLSGSGSTVMALTLSNSEKIGKAMKKVFEESGVACRILVLCADNEGMKLK